MAESLPQVDDGEMREKEEQIRQEGLTKSIEKEKASKQEDGVRQRGVPKLESQCLPRCKGKRMDDKSKDISVKNSAKALTMEVEEIPKEIAALVNEVDEMPKGGGNCERGGGTAQQSRGFSKGGGRNGFANMIRDYTVSIQDEVEEGKEGKGSECVRRYGDQV